jgi:serine/threonine-protein kinase
MSTNEELARWGEPEVTTGEEELAQLVDQLRLQRRGTETTTPQLTAELLRQGEQLAEVAGWLDHFVSSVLHHSGLPLPGEAHRQTEICPPPDADAAHAVPQPFPGEYRLRLVLGEGAFGKVWLADDLRHNMPVALKTIHLSGDVQNVQRALMTLRQEAQLLARVQHPNLVRYYTWRQADEEHYLVLQYVAGGSFEELLEQGGPLDWQQAARYIADVGEALLMLHAQGIVHRDIKPANILWEPERDEALLTDLGLGIRLGGSAEIGGTALYMAPEAFAGEFTCAGDVYSLAATLFHLLTGQPPFPASSLPELLDRVRRQLPQPDPRCTAVPEALEQLLRAGLHPEPARRPTLPAFVQTLRTALNHLRADALLIASGTSPEQAAVQVQLKVRRQTAAGAYVALTTSAQPMAMPRDMKKVPPAPEQLQLHTGDRVRIEVEISREGYVTVFNIGPTGNLNLLYPASSDGPAAIIPAQQPLHILDVALTPPAGRERLFAIWSRMPLPLSSPELRRLATGSTTIQPRSYCATRDMERVQQCVQELRSEDWQAAVVELHHLGA